MYRLFLCISIFLSLSLALFASESIKLNDLDASYNLGTSIEIMEDRSLNLTIDDVSSPEYNGFFKKSEQDIPNLGFSKSAFWVKFNLENLSINEDWILELVFNNLNQIDLYLPVENGFDEIRTGGDISFNERHLKNINFIFKINLKQTEDKTIYLRIWTETSLNFPINLYPEDDFYEKSQRENFIFGIVFGFVLIMIVLQMLNFFIMKEFTYLFAALACLSIVISIFAEVGYFSMFISPDNAKLAYLIMPIGVSSTTFFFTLFSRYFFQIDKKLPFLNLMHNAAVFLSICILISYYFISFRYYIRLASLIFLMILLLLLVTSLKKYIGGYRPARYVLLTFTPVFLLINISALQTIGVISHSSLTIYAIPLSIGIVTLLFTIAIASKMNYIRKEHSETLAESLRHQENLNAVKDQFLSSTAHELRTPLNGIIGLIETVLKSSQNDLSALDRNNLNAATASAWRLSRLINDILDYSKGNNDDIVIDKRSLQIRQIIDVVLMNLSPLFEGKPIEIVNSIGEDLPPVSADENRLQQILFNLIGNALKFTQEGIVEVSAAALNNELKITIADTGIGIAEDRLQSVFDAYDQGSAETSRKYGGTGLGLSVTKQMVELHGGRIWAESRPGEGAKFMFTLPLSKEPALQSSLSGGNTAAGENSDFLSWEIPKNGESRIIAVDDEPLNLRVIKNYLPEEKYLIHPLQSGRRLMENLEIPSPPELVLLDIFMPEVSGYELCSEIRKKYRPHELPVLMLTASNNPADMVQAFSQGANDYITKPVSREELTARVETHIQLKKSVERISLSNKKLGEIDRLINFGFLASSFALRNKVSSAQETVILNKAVEYYKPVLDQYFNQVEGYSENKNNHSYFERIFEEISLMVPEKVKEIFEQISSSVDNDGNSFRDEDVEQITTDVFDLVSSILTAPGKNSGPDWENIQQRFTLTPKETEVATLVFEGYSNQEIADHLGGIAVNTVKQHVYRIFNKVGAENRTHLIYKLLEYKSLN